MSVEPAATLAAAETLHTRLAEAEEMLRAIRQGEIDALVVEGPEQTQVYTLNSAEEPYRILVEQMQEGAVVFTPGGPILYANAQFAAMVEEPLAAVIGSRVERFIGAASDRDFAELTAAGSGRRHSTLVAARSGAFDVSLSLTRTRTPAGVRVNLIVTDLREILAAVSGRDRAERANRTKDEFLAMLAHELRTPLSAISMAVRVGDAAQEGGAPASRTREVIGRQVRHISRLIDDLLDAERMVSGKVRLNREPLDFGEAVGQAIAPFVTDGRLNRQLDVSIESVWVEGDAMRLQQVLTNIVTNAVKYTPAGGQIRVALRANEGYATLTVEDTGFGISARLLPFVFDLYVQADRTLDRARGGLGIGLTLVRKLVELHGGTIVATSDGEGLGSRFTVRLKQVPAVVDSFPAPLTQERRSKPRRVLLIEDSRDAREMLRMMLELAGHAVYDAADGRHGLELLSVVRPDVAIIDLDLPMMDGYQVARRIRQQPNGRGMLLLALTGNDEPDAPARAAANGFDHHLVKPIDPDYLARLMAVPA